MLLHHSNCIFNVLYPQQLCSVQATKFWLLCQVLRSAMHRVKKALQCHVGLPARVWATAGFPLSLHTGSSGKEMPRLIFLENGAEAALCRGYVTVCVCVCQHHWFKRICTTGATARCCESHIRTPGSRPHVQHGWLCAHAPRNPHTHARSHTAMMHISAFGRAALSLVQLHITSLSPLPPSGWTVISPLLSVNAKLWIMDEVQVVSDRSRVLTWWTQTQRETWQGQQASVSASFAALLSPLGVGLALSYLCLHRNKSAG